MIAIRNNRLWIWAPATLLLAVFAALAYIFWPIRGSMPTQPVLEYWPTNGWRTSTPEKQGFDSVKLAAGLQALRDKHLDSLLIIRNGYVILDAYYYPYEKAAPHDLASVTKSITTTLIAIAAGQDKLQLDQPMVSYFSERTIANPDGRKQSITVRNLAGMVNGMKSSCLNGDEATLNAMRSQPDWVQAALDREMSLEPGKYFCYDSPGMHLLSAILQETTGMTELEFAQQNLFAPLGIQEVYWESDPQGHTHGWGDLHLKPSDAAKIGYLFLQNGLWEGRQIVPADWAVEAVKEHINTGRADNYGYGWWVSDESYGAMGRGGQNIKVYPAFKVIVVTTGSNFDYAMLDPILENAFVDSANPLPANPAGMAQLESMLSEIKQGPASQPATDLPEITKVISGKTYQCVSNEVGITSLLFAFSDLQVLKMHMEQNGQEVVWDVGLDGKYRMTSDGFVRGYWEDSQKFILQQFDIGIRVRELQFDGDRLEVHIPEMNITLKCQIQNP